MEKKKALRIFSINEKFTVEELNKNFRLLVKKYHPDKNPQDPQWAHNQMIIINDAYSLLLKQLSVINDSLDKSENIQTEKVKNDYSFEDSFNSEFKISTEYFLSALWIYFLYGLENPHIRKEGTRRFRFRECYNLMEKSLFTIIPLRDYTLSEHEDHIFKTYYYFVLIFFNNLKQEWRPLPDIKINLSYQKNIKSLYLYIKKSLVPDLFETTPAKIKDEDIVLTLSSLHALKSKTDNPIILKELNGTLKFANLFFDLLDLKKKGILSLEI